MGIQILRTKHKIETKEACQDIKMTNELANFDIITGKSGSFDEITSPSHPENGRERNPHSPERHNEDENSEDEEDRKTRESIMV